MNLPLQLDRSSATPLQDQLFEQLRQLIIGGKLKPNSRVIATRFLAEQAGVSRTTVLLAYERLISEGYIETRPAIGTFVAASLPDEPKLGSVSPSMPDIPRQSSLQPALVNGRANGHSHGQLEQLIPALSRRSIDFRPGRCDTSNLLAAKTWMKGVRNVFEREPDGFAAVQSAAGVHQLRSAMADYLAATRGIMSAPEQVIIVAGRRQACSIVARLFQRPADRVVLESPGDAATAAVFESRRAEILGVPVDEYGLQTDLLPAGPVSLAYVTPSRHDPLGGVMPPPRRQALVAWARKTGAYLIEDDSDSEFRYQGTAPQPLATIDPYGLVFYVGSFAMTLGAGLGIGYLVVPSEFADAVVRLKALDEAYGPWLEQMIVFDLVASGEYNHHLRRVRKTCLERRDCLIQALRTHFGDVRLMGVEAGAHLTWLLPDGLPDSDSVRRAAAERGVIVGTLPDRGEISGSARYYCKRALLLGFAALSCEQLRDGVARLAEALGV